MTKEVSKYECDECGKQLWKRYFTSNYIDEDGQEIFCSKKCCKEFMLKNLIIQEVEI